MQPTIDYVFKRIFGYTGNEKITQSLLTAILNEKIEDVDLDCNTFILKNVLDDKIGILDIKVKFNNGVNCDIEMQVVEQSNIIKRLLFYWSKLYVQNINSGEDYGVLKRCIVILFANFELNELQGMKKYLTRWVIKEKNYGKQILTDLFEIAIIELPKVSKYKENTELDTWVKFIRSPEVIDMSEKNENEAVKEAKKVLEDISSDEKERYLAELRQKHIMDQKAIADRGFEKGFEQGIKKGKIDLAKKLLEQGYNINIIIELTELSKKEIEDLM